MCFLFQRRTVESGRVVNSSPVVDGSLMCCGSDQQIVCEWNTNESLRWYLQHTRFQLSVNVRLFVERPKEYPQKASSASRSCVLDRCWTYSRIPGSFSIEDRWRFYNVVFLDSIESWIAKCYSSFMAVNKKLKFFLSPIADIKSSSRTLDVVCHSRKVEHLIVFWRVCDGHFQSFENQPTGYRLSIV